MRKWLIFLGLGLAVWAQLPLPERSSAMHYDASRNVLILVVGEERIEGDRIEVVDLIGRRVFSQGVSVSGGEAVSVPLPSLPEGLYYARWVSENGRVRAVRRFAVPR
ncbi:MAG: hypothetical protein N3A68_06000 [Bacteroidia bacterium]|jgi:hypothetical protein|nr:hypothetical protein [Bacteroidia bacterium]GIV24001.1 MAG: hypothetical protein KatS3mg025_1660 [Bacteroidia bacterium]